MAFLILHPFQRITFIVMSDLKVNIEEIASVVK